MKRILTFLAMFLMVGIAHAAYNIRQQGDGSMVFEYSRDKTAPVKITNKGDLENFGRRIQWFDDFLGDALNAQYSISAGVDAQAVAPAISVANKGIVRLTTGNAGTGALTDGSSLTQELVWKASNGGLVMEANVTLSSAANIVVNVGFTDAKADNTLEIPIEVSGTSTLTTNASDAVVFAYDTNTTTDNWKCVGVSSNTDATVASSGITPVASTYQKLRIEVDTSGNADFFIDGSKVCTVASAVSTATTLTPIVVATARTTTSKNVDVDYLFIAQNR